jgi:hypothetical protein
MDAINRREHLTHIRRLPVYGAKRNLCQEVKVMVFEEWPHPGSPSAADHGPGRLLSPSHGYGEIHLIRSRISAVPSLDDSPV